MELARRGGSAALKRLFTELVGQLEAAGVILKQGAMLDAALIETQAAARRGPDQGSGLVRSILTRPATSTTPSPPTP